MKKTDFEKVVEWLEDNHINFTFGRSDGNTRSWIIADLYVDVLSNLGEDKEKTKVTFQFDFLAGKDGNNDIFEISILDIISFRCDRLELYDSYIDAWDSYCDKGIKIYLSE